MGVNERNINTPKSGSDQLHSEAKKNSFAIVHSILRQSDRSKMQSLLKIG